MDRRRILKSLAAASGTAIVSACGGGSVGSGQPVLLPGPTPAPAPTPVPTPTPTPAASFDSYGTRFASGVTDSAGRAKIWPHIYIHPFNGVDGRGGSTLAQWPNHRDHPPRCRHFVKIGRHPGYLGLPARSQQRQPLCLRWPEGRWHARRSDAVSRVPGL